MKDDPQFDDLADLVAERDALLAALRAAEQFLAPEIDRGPAINGWQNTVDMVRATIARANAEMDAERAKP